MVAKLRIRGERLSEIQELIEARGIITLRWEFAKYRIQTTLTSGEKNITDGITIEHFNYFLEEKIIFQESVDMIRADFPDFNKHQLCLEDIKEFYIETKGFCNLQRFLDDYFKITYNSRGIWDNFKKGNGISESAFKLFCDFLGYDWQELGTEDQGIKKIPDFEKLEIILSKLDHKSQNEFYQKLSESSVIGFKITNFENKKLTYNLFWLIKRLFKSIDQNWKTIDIDFNSLSISNNQGRLKFLIQEIGVANKTLNKQIENRKITSEAITEKIINSLSKEHKNVIIFLRTYEKDQVKELDEFVKLIGIPLKKQLKEKKSELFTPKIVFVWLFNLASCPIESSVKLFQNEIKIVSHFSKTDLLEWIEEEQIINQISQWKRGLALSQNPEEFLEQVWTATQTRILDNPDKIKPEIVLECFYKFTLNQWEEHQDRWKQL